MLHSTALTLQYKVWTEPNCVVMHQRVTAEMPVSVDWPWQRCFVPPCSHSCCGASTRASKCSSGAESVGRRSPRPSHQTLPMNLIHKRFTPTHHHCRISLNAHIFPDQSSYATKKPQLVYRQQTIKLVKTLLKCVDKQKVQNFVHTRDTTQLKLC